MKKVCMAILALCAAFVLAGCNKKEAGNKVLTKENLKVGFVYIGSINDEGYTQAHDKGRLAVEAMGISTAYVENVAENSDCEKAIRDLIDQGCNMIFTTSFGFMDWTLKVAEEFPDVHFAHCSGYKQAVNMCSYFGKVYQARYLAGIVAGMNSKSGKIGYVAAFPIPECIRGINAFTLGVQSVNPNATVEVVWTRTWFDPAVEKQAALELLNRGCDLLEQHQDTTAPQIAAQEKGALAIGYNVPSPNAAPKAYLTAPLFNWPVFYTANVQALLDGKWEGRAYWEGIDQGWVGLDELSALCVPGTQEAVDVAMEAMKAKTFEPFTGPLFDQDGTEKIASGVMMTDDDIWNMSWFVKGVIGSTN